MLFYEYILESKNILPQFLFALINLIGLVAVFAKESDGGESIGHVNGLV